MQSTAMKFSLLALALGAHAYNLCHILVSSPPDDVLLKGKAKLKGLASPELFENGVIGGLYAYHDSNSITVIQVQLDSDHKHYTTAENFEFPISQDPIMQPVQLTSNYDGSTMTLEDQSF
jgi:hypothetical protein